jgi:hypothetical protein
MAVLGRSTITLTANTYARLTDATRRLAADMMDQILALPRQTTQG